MRLFGILTFVFLAGFAFAQSPQPSLDEQQDLMRAVNDGSTSPMDLIRGLEAFLVRYPASSQRADIEHRLGQAAIDARDITRIAKYGVKVLDGTPNDLLFLDRVTSALLAIGGKDNADRAYKYARTFEDLIDAMKVEPGRDADKRQDERDRAMGRSILYEARARAATREYEEAERLSAHSYAAYPNEESAREWSDALAHLGRDGEAIAKLADAFAIPDGHTTDAYRLDDRLRLGELYTKLHGSEKGLGDLVLAAYDRTSTLIERRKKTLLALDPNSTVADPLQFTLTGLDGKRFRLTGEKGKLIVLDFWATWCLPCRVEHPLMQTLKERFKRSDVVFYEISGDEDKSLVEPFLDDQKWDKNVYFDEGLSRLLKVENIPSTILFDKSGKVASRMDGFDPETFLESMTQRINALLN